MGIRVPIHVTRSKRGASLPGLAGATNRNTIDWRTKSHPDSYTPTSGISDKPPRRGTLDSHYAARSTISSALNTLGNFPASRPSRT